MNKKTKAAPRAKKLTPAKKLSTIKPLSAGHTPGT